MILSTVLTVLTGFMITVIVNASCFSFDKMNFYSFSLTSMNWMKISNHYRNKQTIFYFKYLMAEYFLKYYCTGILENRIKKEQN